jgi:hypothetical protein
MNDYEAKQEAKRERLLDRAHGARKESADQRRRMNSIAVHIPLGQPILVGHHSERRHRRDLSAIDNAMRKSVEASKYAADLERRAAAVGTGGISSDDPEAVAKLKPQLAERERDQDEMKRINREFKTTGDLSKVDMPEATRLGIERQWAVSPYEKRPFPAYALQNNNAQIRRLSQRVTELEAKAAAPDADDIVGVGYRITEKRDDNRILVELDEKPPREVRDMLKSNGFRWSPTRAAWCRQINNRAWFCAELVAKELDKLPQD